MPEGFQSTRFADHRLTPSPSCLSAAPNGDVYVGVDMNGSLGKGAGKGRVVKLVDTNGDGQADTSSVFVELGNPRGLMAVGRRLFVLHTEIPESTGVVSGMHLSVFEDLDQDGVADGPGKRLIKNVSTLKHNQSRGADHTTNGIRMGIDGWIYIAVGDYGFVDAEGADGKKLTQLGGGVLRVRPDGTEMEMYTHGLRNIYDVAIDPFMNIYTRGNTNDGGGWNVRFIHHIQSGQYGYPVLYKHFTDEIIPALADLGGGSGTGSLFLQEPGWPKAYNNVPMMGDWGRNQLFIHRLQKDGASFTQQQEKFISCSQLTDVDVDGSGRLYLAAWEGAGYKGNARKGYIQRVVPKAWKYVAFPHLEKLSDTALMKGLKSESATVRLHVQQELLARSKSLAPQILKIAGDASCSLESRVAALFTYAQMLGDDAQAGLLGLAETPELREWALRAAADRLPYVSGLPLDPFFAGLKDQNPRVQLASAVALGRIGQPSVAHQLLAVAVPPAPAPPSKQKGHQGGPHATPHAAVLVPHVAVQALIRLQAVDACLQALDGTSRGGALWALRWMHEPEVVSGLLKKLDQTKDAGLRRDLLTSLGRLYHKEADYDGSWWWGTRPDTRGPYYVPVQWSESEKIEQVFRKEWAAADAGQNSFLTAVANRHRMNLEGIGKVEVAKKSGKGSKGEVGRTSIEDVMLALGKHKGNKKRGQKVLSSLSCVACHNIKAGDVIKGPDLLSLGKVMNREQIAESILKPDATIAESWVSVTMNNGAQHLGTLVEKTSEKVVVHNIAGIATTLKASEVKSIQKQTSTLMGPGLVNDLTLKQFSDLVEYLASMK
ncbi:DUF7133 domain-containing protein [Oceaniferula marina]|nr:c-type cytochrome [Oceaniferula marina]